MEFKPSTSYLCLQWAGSMFTEGKIYLSNDRGQIRRDDIDVYDKPICGKFVEVTTHDVPQPNTTYRCINPRYSWWTKDKEYTTDAEGRITDDTDYRSRFPNQFSKRFVVVSSEVEEIASTYPPDCDVPEEEPMVFEAGKWYARTKDGMGVMPKGKKYLCVRSEGALYLVNKRFGLTRTYEVNAEAYKEVK